MKLKYLAYFRPLFVLMAILVLLGCTHDTNSLESISNKSTRMSSKMDESRIKGVVNAPEFPRGLKWFNTDYPLTLQELKGKVVLLDFWTYCCINCHHVFPDLKRLEEEFKDELVVIGVHSAKFENERDSENIKEAILRHKIEHPVVNDAEMQVWQRYGIRAWPSFVLINPAGRIVGQTSGEGIYERVKPAIEQVIETFEEMDMLNKEPKTFVTEAQKSANKLLSFPAKITSNKDGLLFITDSNHNRIVAIDKKGAFKYAIGGSEKGSLVDGTFEEARFNQPQGLFYADQKLYVADTENHALRVVDLKNKSVSTLLGNGKQGRPIRSLDPNKEVTALNSPWDVILHDGYLYVAMAGNHQIWKIDPKTAKAIVWAGTSGENIVDGPRLEALLAQPSGLTVLGDQLYFADSEVSGLRHVGFDTDAEVKTDIGEGLFVYGDKDGKAKNARLQHPLGVATYDGKIVIADTYNNKIKIFDPETKKIKTLVGSGKSGMTDGSFDKATLNEAAGVYVEGDELYIVDTNNHIIRKANLKTEQLETLKLSGFEEEQLKMASSTEAKQANDFDIEFDTSSNTFELELILPKDTKINPLAVSEIIFKTEEKAKIEIKEAVSTLVLPASVMDDLNKNKKVDADIIIYYCDKGQEGLCYYEYKKIGFNLTEGKSSNRLEIDLNKADDWSDLLD